MDMECDSINWEFEKRSTMQVSGASYFFAYVNNVSFDGAIVSAEKYKCMPGFIINSLLLFASLFQIILKRSIAILKYK